MTLKKQNAFPPYPIVSRFTRVSFQHTKVSCHSYIDESDRDTQPASYDEFGAFQIFEEQVSMEP